MRRRSTRETESAVRADEGHGDAPLSAPPGVRVFRGRVGGTDYAVLMIPQRNCEARGVLLTKAEREVIELALQGLSNEAIAALRRTSGRTVANQLRAIYGKLGIASRLELAAAAVGHRRPGQT